MTIAPWKSFWPKRWLRSFAGAALATAIVGSTLWAVDPANGQPKSPAAPKVPDLPKVELPKDDAPKAPAAPKEKLITFAMADKPWQSVIDFYRDESGLAFNSVEKPPTGTFNFSPPKDPKTGLPKKFTLTEITDIINESLLTRNMVLIRQNTTFRLWPADKPIDPVLVRRVSLDELKTLADRDMVQVVLELKSLVAADQYNDVRMMKSPVGEVVLLQGRNGFIITDLAGNIRRIVSDLTAGESEEAVAADHYAHKCKYIKSHVAASQLRDILGAEGAPAEVAAIDPRANMRDMFRSRFEGFDRDRDRDRRDFDPRSFGSFDPRSFNGSGFSSRSSGGFSGSRTLRPTRVVSDDATNTVHINGPADKVSAGKAYLVKVDVGDVPIVIGPPKFETYTVPAGTADTLVLALQDSFRQSSVRIRALSPNQIVVYATPADQLDVIEMINNITKGQKEQTKIFEVTELDVNDAVTMLKAMFPSQATGGPYIDVHPNGTGIVVRGKQEQVSDVEAALQGIGGGGEAVGPTSSKLRIINLKEGSTGDLAEAIRKYMEAMGIEGVKVNRIGGGSPMPPERKSTPLTPEVLPREVPKKPALPGEKKGALEPGNPRKYTLGVRDLTDTTLVAMNTQLRDVTNESKKKSGEPAVTITAVGDKLIITGSDPQAVKLANDLARQIINTKGESYEVFRLQHANAVEAARVLNEWFNPPPPQQPNQRNQNPFAQFFGRGRGGQTDPAGAVAEPQKPRVRIVAEQSSNSLLVRANLLDLITIKNMLEKVIDVGPGDSKAVVKPFYIGPLQYAVATEVVGILQEVFRESTNQATNLSGGVQGGFAGLFGRGGRGGRNQQPLDAMGQPRQVTLTIAADDRTNSIVGTATELMANDIKEMVKVLEDKAKDSTKVVELVQTKGIDPVLVQEVLDAIQGRTPATQPQTPGMTPFGTSGRSPFGTTGFGGSRFGGFGGTRGGFSGFGGTRGGTRGGFGGTRGSFGGSRRGGRIQRAPDVPPAEDISRGPDFFDQRDMDVPQQTLLYDPYEENLKLIQAGEPLPSAPRVLDTVQFAGNAGPLHLPPAPGATAEKRPPVGNQQPPTGRLEGPFELIGPRGPVTANPLEEFGAVIITANNQADLQLAIKIIEQLRKYLETEQIAAGPQLKIVELENGDAAEIAEQINSLGARASGTISQVPPIQAFPGVQPGVSAGSGSVLAVPVPRRNAIMLFGPELRFPYYVNLIKELDGLRNTNVPVAIQLKKASAQQVANQLTQFYANRYPGATNNLIRFTYSTSANTVYVQASPADLEEIKLIIEKLDTDIAPVNEFRIFRLRNAPAEDLAATLQIALMQNILPQGTGIVQAATGPGAVAGAQPGLGQQGFGQQGFGQQGPLGQQLGLGGAGQAGRGGVFGQLGSQITNTTKTVSLRFLVPGKDGSFQSGYLEDVHITPDVRSNSLVISAPKETLDLLEAVIKTLDVPAATVAQVNIFTLKRADAVLTANLLQQLFSGTRQAGQPGAPAGPGGPGGPAGPLGQAGPTTTQGFRPLLTASGLVSEGAGLVNLSIAVDDRTNSIIVAATQSDLDAIRAIIARLEAADGNQRATQVIKLRHASAVDVATVLNQFLPLTLTNINTGLVQTNYLQTSREVVVAPEPVTNNLLINAHPAALAQLIPIIERLDAAPLQVSVEVLIAEVLLTNNEEFGVEIGLQSPVLFDRQVIPTNSVGYANVAGGTAVPPGVTVTGNQNSFPGQAFAFNTTANPLYSQAQRVGIVGLQGITNYGVGRASQNGIGGFVFSAGSDTVNVLIRALKTQGRIDNLNRPTITVLDNQIGSVNIGGLFPYTSGGNFNQLGGFQPIISQQQIGTTLTVTPRISPEGRILMRIEPSIVAPEDTLVPLGNGQFATAFRQQAVTTTVSVLDGETIVLGGLISKSNNRSENKVPWLGDLPYIGAAFRFRTQTQEKRELLVIMTPHVIRCAADNEKFLIEEARKMNWVLKDVDRLYGSAAAAAAVPDTILPKDAWVQPPPGVLIPVPGTPEPAVPVPIPPAKNGPDPLPPPIKPIVPELPPKIPIPDPPKPAVAEEIKPAEGIVVPNL